MRLKSFTLYHKIKMVKGMKLFKLLPTNSLK